jgi:hypothetical protein
MIPHNNKEKIKKVLILMLLFLGLFGFTYGVSYEIDTGTYSKVLSIAAKTTSPVGMWMSTDNNKLFVSSANTVYEYITPTLGDINLSTFYKSYSVAGKLTTGTGLFVNPTGTTFYMNTISGTTIYQFTMSTPWDVSTATYTKFGKIETGGATAYNDIYISPNGYNVYVLDDGFATRRIYQYVLETAWDINTISFVRYNTTSNLPSQKGLTFNDNGTKMYIIRDGSSTNDIIYQYTLSTPWDVSTLLNSGKTLSINAEDTAPKKIRINNTGDILLMLGDTTNSVYQYDLSNWCMASPYTLTDLNITSKNGCYLNISDSNITDSNLIHSTITNSIATNIINTDVNWTDSNIYTSDLNADRFTNCNIYDSNVTYSTLTNSTTRTTNVSNDLFYNSSVYDLNGIMNYTNIFNYSSKIYDSNFYNSDINSKRIYNSNLIDSNIYYSDIYNTNIDGLGRITGVVNFEDSNIAASNLIIGEDMTDSTLNSVTLNNVNITVTNDLNMFISQDIINSNITASDGIFTLYCQNRDGFGNYYSNSPLLSNVSIDGLQISIYPTDISGNCNYTFSDFNIINGSIYNSHLNYNFTNFSVYDSNIYDSNLYNMNISNSNFNNYSSSNVLYNDNITDSNFTDYVFGTNINSYLLSSTNAIFNFGINTYDNIKSDWNILYYKLQDNNVTKPTTDLNEINYSNFNSNLAQVNADFVTKYHWLFYNYTDSLGNQYDPFFYIPYIDSNFHFYVEDTNTRLVPTKFTFDGIDYAGSIDVNGNVTVSYPDLTGDHIIYVELAGYSSRTIELLTDTNTSYDYNIGLIDEDYAQDIDFIFKDINLATVSSKYIQVWDLHKNQLLGGGRTTSSGSITFNINSDLNYYTFRRYNSDTNFLDYYDYNVRPVLVKKPIDESTGLTIANFNIVLSGLASESYSGLAADKNVFIITNTVDPFIFTINDGAYCERSYELNLPGDPFNYILQPVLIPTADCTTIYVYVYDKVKNTPIEGVTVTASKQLPNLGKKVVETQMSDSTGITIFNTIALDQYYFDFYIDGVLKLATVNKISTNKYYAYIDTYVPIVTVFHQFDITVKINNGTGKSVDNNGTYDFNFQLIPNPNMYINPNMSQFCDYYDIVPCNALLFNYDQIDINIYQGIYGIYSNTFYGNSFSYNGNFNIDVNLIPYLTKPITACITYYFKDINKQECTNIFLVQSTWDLGATLNAFLEDRLGGEGSFGATLFAIIITLLICAAMYGIMMPISGVADWGITIVALFCLGCFAMLGFINMGLYLFLASGSVLFLFAKNLGAF